MELRWYLPTENKTLLWFQPLLLLLVLRLSFVVWALPTSTNHSETSLNVSNYSYCCCCCVCGWDDNGIILFILPIVSQLVFLSHSLLISWRLSSTRFLRQMQCDKNWITKSIRRNLFIHNDLPQKCDNSRKKDRKKKRNRNRSRNWVFHWLLLYAILMAIIKHTLLIF